MNNEEKIIYSYNDKISFRQCSLSSNTNNLNFGDCTCFYTKEENWKTHYFCEQFGIHLHCTKHKEQELIKERNYSLKCPKCNNSIEIEGFDKTLKDCLKLLNIPKFKNAKFIRLDDYYVPEIKERINLEEKSNYWIQADIKTDKDQDTMIVLYIGKKDSKEKCQFFIKPEKLQLANDHKDLDPATILSKIEVTLKDRIIKQEYDND